LDLLEKYKVYLTTRKNISFNFASTTTDFCQWTM